MLIGTQSNKANTGSSQIMSFLTSWREWLVRTQGSSGLDMTVLMCYVPHTPALRSVSWTYHIAPSKASKKGMKSRSGCAQNPTYDVGEPRWCESKERGTEELSPFLMSLP